MLIVTILQTFFSGLIKSRVGQLAITLLIGLGLGVLVHKHYSVPITIVQTTPEVRTVTVEKPVLTEREVDKIIKDPKDQALIKQLMDENKALNSEVTTLNFIVALNKMGGSGPVTVTSTNSCEGVTFEFTDYQLHATSDLKVFNYTLKQEFRVITTKGRQKDGTSIDLAGLFQVTPDGYVNIPITSTVIIADNAVNKWIMSPRVQVGVGRLSATGGVLAFQWLKHGKSTDPNDLSVAVGSPALFIGNGIHEVGLLPISFNTGRLPHNPLSNLWISPFVNRSKLGIVISATF